MKNAKKQDIKGPQIRRPPTRRGLIRLTQVRPLEREGVVGAVEAVVSGDELDHDVKRFSLTLQIH
jgi:hypothetical protein